MTRASRNPSFTFADKTKADRVGFAERLKQSKVARAAKPSSVGTVKSLISELRKFPPDAKVFGEHPPFDGVRIIPQHSGAVLIASFPSQTAAKKKANTPRPAIGKSHG